MWARETENGKRRRHRRPMPWRRPSTASGLASLSGPRWPSGSHSGSLSEGGEPDGGSQGAVAEHQLGAALGDAGGFLAERRDEHLLEAVARVLANCFGDRGS